MSLRFGPKRFILLAAAAWLTAGAGARPPRLAIEPSVFTSTPCLAPRYDGCDPERRRVPIMASASQALLAGDPAPRLPLQLAGLLDLGPGLAGAGATAGMPGIKWTLADRPR